MYIHEKTATTPHMQIITKCPISHPALPIIPVQHHPQALLHVCVQLLRVEFKDHRLKWLHAHMKGRLGTRLAPSIPHIKQLKYYYTCTCTCIYTSNILYIYMYLNKKHIYFQHVCEVYMFAYMYIYTLHSQIFTKLCVVTSQQQLNRNVYIKCHVHVYIVTCT